MGNREHNLTAEVIRDLADAIAYKEMGDKMKIQYLVSRFEVKLDKKILDDVVSFRGKFMHTGMDQEMEAWTNYENLLGILERTLQCWGGRDIHISISCLITA